MNVLFEVGNNIIYFYKRFTNIYKNQKLIFFYKQSKTAFTYCTQFFNTSKINNETEIGLIFAFKYNFLKFMYDTYNNVIISNQITGIESWSITLISQSTTILITRLVVVLKKISI